MSSRAGWTVLDGAVKPHASAIAAIIVDGTSVAVIVHKPGEAAAAALHGLEWDGSVPVFGLSGVTLTRVAETSASMGGEVTQKWLKSHRPGRLFVFWGDGTLLINYAQGAGFNLEPGSTDMERLRSMN
jgi:hypothetical protein